MKRRRCDRLPGRVADPLHDPRSNAGVHVGPRPRFGGAAEPRARALVAGRSGRRVGWLRMSPGWTAGAEAVLSRELVAARVGWRLALVGDEVTVLQARAFAVEAGALAHLQAEGSLHTLRAHEGTLQLSGGGQ
ncbi:hypothetical protein [Prescottella equi]|uniref:hypothetical protein n=1 Tax=Rhodococcus hoagii TaxID=43767 RepID=UPI0011A4C4DA|nr:hypothetical protein [Prescottella equi]